MITIESVEIFDRTREQIEDDLKHLGPSVLVVGSRITEDGYELVLEGSTFQIQDLIYLWGQGEGEGEVNYLPEVQ